ncbi:MAG: bifunctional oligoribonuclease/PAP phosphatase NrnA [Candidatus Omnitrophota bacterium]
MSLKKAAACVRKNKSFLVTCHTNAEADALGAGLAFCRLLKALGKNALMVNEEKPLGEYDFLPGIQEIKIRPKGRLDFDFDCLAVLDCSDLLRTGEVYRLKPDAAAILNIDHHVSNINFGDVNWVEPGASSASEMVYRLYKELEVPIGPETALLLYAGIMTDTGSFRYDNTTSDTHKIIAELLRHKINVSEVYRNIYGNIPFTDMLLLAKVLPTMQRNFNGRVIWFHVRKRLLRQHKNFSFDFSEQVLSFARLIKDVEVCVLLKENLGPDNEIRVNFRSQGSVDVNKIAACFGGGGHKAASGATIKGDIVKIRKRVLNKIREALDK